MRQHIYATRIVTPGRHTLFIFFAIQCCHIITTFYENRCTEANIFLTLKLGDHLHFTLTSAGRAGAVCLCASTYATPCLRILFYCFYGSLIISLFMRSTLFYNSILLFRNYRLMVELIKLTKPKVATHFTHFLFCIIQGWFHLQKFSNKSNKTA